MKYRYIRKNGLYIPEASKDGIKWVGIKVDNINDLMKNFLKFNENYVRCKLTFGDSKDIFFHDEISVNMFLAGFKIMYEEKITEFEHLN